MPQSRANLFLVEPNGKREILLADKITIGRASNNDLVLDHSAVTRYHAEIIRERAQFFIRDLKSMNGTFRNRQPLEPEQLHRLYHQDQIQIAQCGAETFAATLLFEDPDATHSLLAQERMPTGVSINVDKREVWVDDKPLHPLPPEQFRLLLLLTGTPNKVFTRDEIAQFVWTEDQPDQVSNQMIDALVYRLRKRIDEVSPGKEYVENVRGHGYRFNPRP